MNLTSTPYDDVFRTLLNDCSRLIIPVINEVFGEHYTGREKIIFFPNEHFLNQQDGNEQERITDTNFKIMGAHEKKYHWECQSSTDNSMLVRFFEYDAQIALDDGEIKGLLFLIPFYIFTHENRFEEFNTNATELGILKKEYAVIKNRLEELLAAKTISEYTKCTIIDMSNRVLEHIAQKYENVRKGVKEVMGGKVLEYEAKAIKTEGRKEGRDIGRLEMLLELVHNNLLSVKDAASQAKLTEEAFWEAMQNYRKE